MSVLREDSGTRWLTLIASAVIVSVLVIVLASLLASPGSASPVSVPVSPACGTPSTPTVDGRVMAGDAYTKIADLVGGSKDFGDAFFACDSAGDFYFAMRLNGASITEPVANENVYACKPPKPGKDPKPGECTTGDNPNYHVDYETGWETTKKGRHTFKDLLNSDRARFQVACDGVPVHDFIQDYLRQDQSGNWFSDADPAGNGSVIALPPADSDSSLKFNLENLGVTDWGNDSGENPLTQSPPFNPKYPDNDFPGWEWNMIYEFKVTGSAYDGCGSVTFDLPPFPGQTAPVGGLHNSPAKDEEGVFISFPDITVEKTGSQISKIGDDATYQITITNSGDVTLFKQSIIDSLLGDLTDGANATIVSSDCGDSLTAGSSCTISAARAVQPGDPDPLPNTVDVVYDSQADLQGVEATSSSSHEVDLFQPGITVDKSADAPTAHIGDDVNYTFVITNTSSGDAPDLVMDSITDDVLGDLADGGNPFVTSSDCGPSLASGASCTISATRAIDAGDPDPLVNNVTVHYHPDEFPNDITNSDSDQVGIVHPDIAVVKECTGVVHEGEQIEVTATVTNPGDVELDGVTATDSDAGPLALQSGDSDGDTKLDTDETWVFTGSYTAPAGTETIDTVTVEGTDFLQDQHSTVSDTDECRTVIINPGIMVVKECTGFVHEGDLIEVTATVTNTGDTPLHDITVVDSDAGALAYVSGDTNGDTLLDLAEAWTFEGSYAAPVGDKSSNTVTATGLNGNDFQVQDTDDCTTIIIHPDIAVAKECTGFVHEGDLIEVTATVTNPGDVALGNVSVTDSDAGALAYVSGDADGDTELDPAETWIFEGSYAAPVGDESTDTVTAQGTDFLLDQHSTVEDTDDCRTVIINPDIAVVKECTGLVHEGETINVTATVTNPGDVALGSVSVVDDHAGPLAFQSGDSDGDTKLDTDETWVFTGSYTAPAGAETIDTVTVEGTDFLQDQHSTVEDTDECKTVIINPAIHVVKECTGFAHESDLIGVRAIVTNAGDVPLANVGVTDSEAGAIAYVSGDTNGDTLLDLAETWIFEGSYQAPPGDVSIDTVTAEGTDPLQLTVDDTDDCRTEIIHPGIAVVKECTGLVHEGETINVTATVTNPGDVALGSVSVVDDHAGPLAYVSGDADGDTELDTNETWIFEGSYAAPAGTFSVDMVTAQGTDFLADQHSTVEATDECETVIINPAIHVVKECTGLVHEGDQITVKATVTNPGDVPLANVSVTDSDAGALAYVSGDTNGDTMLDLTETWIFEGSYAAPIGDETTDTVAAEGTDPLQLTVDDTDECRTEIIHPDIAVVKECTGFAHEGDLIDVKATVTNPGDVPLANVSVADSDAGALAYVSGDTDGDTMLDLGETWVFEGSYAAPIGDETTDTVTAEGTDPLQLTVDDTDDCRTEIIHPAIAVVKECTGLVHEGEQIEVTATVTNPGDVELDGVTATDSDAGPLAFQSGDSDGDTKLDTDETWVFTGSYTAPAGAETIDTVTVEGTDFLQDQHSTVSDTDECRTEIINPGIQVVKECTGLVHEGDLIEITATVTNAGDVPLANVSATDSDAGALAYVSGDTNGDTMLDLAETWVFQGNYPAPVGTESTDTVTAKGTDPLQLTVEDTDDCRTEIINPGMDVVKECTGLVHEGEDIEVWALVSNTGDTPLHDVTVVDSDAGALTYVVGDDNPANGLLDLTEVWLFTGVYAAPPGALTIDTVLAEGVDALQATVQDSDSCETVIINPGIHVVKECTGVVHEGDVIEVTAIVTNTGDIALADVSVTDSDAGALAYVSGDTNGDTMLDLTETWIFEGSYAAPVGDETTDTVTAQGIDPLELIVEDDDQCTTKIIHPDIAVVKECTGLVHEGETINVRATVTNPGDVPLANVSVTDSDAGALAYVSGDTNGDTMLDLTETWIFEGSYAAPVGDETTDMVTAQGMDALDLTVEAVDECTTEIIHPDIAVVKECTNIVQPGGQIDIQATVTNAGDTDLFNITASDSLAGALAFVSGDTDGDTELDVDETWVFTGSHTAPESGPVTDTVTVEGADVLEMTVSDSADCVTEIDQLPEIEVDKSADGTDPDSDFTDDESTTVNSTVTYKVVIDNDSAEPVTITSLLDDTYPGIVCKDSDGHDVVGQTLAADDGDGPGAMNGGDDEITCTFQTQAPSTGESVVTDVVTVDAEDDQGNPASDDDDATIRTPPAVVLGPTPTPAPSPAALPPTGGLGALTGDSSNLILLALIGLTLIGGSAWIIWSNRRWNDRLQ